MKKEKVKTVLVFTDLTGIPIRIVSSRKAAYSGALYPFIPPRPAEKWPLADAVASIRFQVFERSRGECEHCGGWITYRTMHLDEIVPRGKGGEISLGNCQALCAGCHIVRPDSKHGRRRPRFGMI